MKWEVGKSYTWKDANAKIDFVDGDGCPSPLNSDISEGIGDKPFTINEFEGAGWIDVIEIDGVLHTAKTVTGKDTWAATYIFSPSDRKFFREVGEVETVKEKVTTDSKVIGQLKRLFSSHYGSRYGLTMVKFSEANEGKPLNVSMISLQHLTRWTKSCKIARRLKTFKKILNVVKLNF